MGFSERVMILSHELFHKYYTTVKIEYDYYGRDVVYLHLYNKLCEHTITLNLEESREFNIENLINEYKEFVLKKVLK